MILSTVILTRVSKVLLVLIYLCWLTHFWPFFCWWRNLFRSRTLWFTLEVKREFTLPNQIIIRCISILDMECINIKGGPYDIEFIINKNKLDFVYPFQKSFENCWSNGTKIVIFIKNTQGPPYQLLYQQLFYFLIKKKIFIFFSVIFRFIYFTKTPLTTLMPHSIITNWTIFWG